MKLKIGALIVYVILIILYAIIYMYLGPSHINGLEDGDFIDPFYFSSTIMSSTGFGDITAKTKTAKLVVSSQMLIVLLLVGILIIDI